MKMGAYWRIRYYEKRIYKSKQKMTLQYFDLKGVLL